MARSKYEKSSLVLQEKFPKVPSETWNKSRRENFASTKIKFFSDSRFFFFWFHPEIICIPNILTTNITAIRMQIYWSTCSTKK